MEPKFKFEKIIIWQKAMDYGETINDIAELFPQKEMYNLSSQIRRAADSIALNIAEGSTGQTNPEFKKFMGYAIRSLAEVITCLHKAKRRKYIPTEKFYMLYDEAFNSMNMMIAFRKNIK
ncbi:four helix bundle protein [Galbibacter sp. EGI 63066]|uniref:four helix bundle protein n=1 Tax=Galbibacter sp. EGI 63066 TaxID=2993559 RepID=UPI00224958FB|nr:four helix bundle protein [Galbibacter sp. EGI 63066]MCX2679692.1 four helix bundle protein [Galbibacter sp. EGI 63066]